jgi:Flp pilus assembly protein TadG
MRPAMIPALFRRRSGGDRHAAPPRSLFTLWHRRPTGESGIASFEFAAAAPILLVMFGGVTDLSIAIWDHMTTASAVEAGAVYAFTQGQQVSGSAAVGPFLTNVAAIVAATSRSGATLSTPNITVTYNNLTNGNNFGSCYCVPATGVFPGTTTACGDSCADGTIAGAFVEIQAVYQYTPLSPVDAPFLSGSYTDTAIVRVQ